MNGIKDAKALKEAAEEMGELLGVDIITQPLNDALENLYLTKVTVQLMRNLLKAAENDADRRPAIRAELLEAMSQLAQVRSDKTKAFDYKKELPKALADKVSSIVSGPGKRKRE